MEKVKLRKTSSKQNRCGRSRGGLCIIHAQGALSRAQKDVMHEKAVIIVYTAVKFSATQSSKDCKKVAGGGGNSRQRGNIFWVFLFPIQSQVVFFGTPPLEPKDLEPPLQRRESYGLYCSHPLGTPISALQAKAQTLAATSSGHLDSENSSNRRGPH